MANSVDTWMKLAENDYVVAEHKSIITISVWGQAWPAPCFHLS